MFKIFLFSLKPGQNGKNKIRKKGPILFFYFFIFTIVTIFVTFAAKAKEKTKLAKARENLRVKEELNLSGMPLNILSSLDEAEEWHEHPYMCGLPKTIKKFKPC